MRNIFFTLLVLVPFLVIGQTSQEEYNYLTLGYAEQVAKGLDMKNGYELRKVSSSKTFYYNDKYRQITVKALHATNGDFKGLLVELYRSSNEHKQYYCVPATGSDREIWSQFNKSIYKGLSSYKEFSQNTFRNFCVIVLEMYENSLK